MEQGQQGGLLELDHRRDVKKYACVYVPIFSSSVQFRFPKRLVEPTTVYFFPPLHPIAVKGETDKLSRRCTRREEMGGEIEALNLTALPFAICHLPFVFLLLPVVVLIFMRFV